MPALYILLTPYERSLIEKEIDLWTDITDLHWHQLVKLGFLFIRTEFNGFSPGGHLVTIAVEAIVKRAVDQNKPINE